MWVRVAGIGFWALTVLVTFRLTRLPDRLRVSKTRSLLWVFLLVIAGVILFRPHENIFGGQDGGAYFNLGVRAGHDPSLCFKDPLMARVPRRARADFLYYGPNRPYQSKYACGCVKDLAKAVHGPWFQIAPTLALSIPAWLGGPKLTLLVMPLFALLAALALRAVAATVIDHPWAGPIAFLFYVCQPLVAWHGRCVRPELIASFLILSGGALLLHAGARTHWRRTPDLVLGAVCLALAPFFHITAWMVLLPVAFLVGCVLLAGRDDFVLYPIIQYAGLALFVWQIVTITDTYHLYRRIRPFATRLPLAILPLVAATVLLILGLVARRRSFWSRIGMKLKWSRLFPRIFAGVLLAAFIGCTLWARQTRPVVSFEPAMSYLYRTDLLAVANMLSKPIALLGLAGLLALVLSRRGRPVTRWLVLLALVPASLTIGNLYDFFMTRYMLVALLPLLALSLTGLVALLPSRGAVGQGVSLLAAVVIVSFNVHGRTHLFTLTDYRGFTDYLAHVTSPIVEDNGIMLAEYPQIAAPMDLSFSVPTLALYNERDRDYRRALASWRKVMLKNSSRPAYFVTPFENPPYDDHFRFEFIDASDYMGTRLLDNFWDLPNRTGPWGCRLSRYRMTVRGEDEENAPGMFPYTVTFDAGNMGVSGFGQVEEFEMTATGRWVKPGSRMKLTLPAVTAATSEGTPPPESDTTGESTNSPSYLEDGALRREGTPSPVSIENGEDWRRGAPTALWVIAVQPDDVPSSQLSVVASSNSIAARAENLRGAWWLYKATLPDGWHAAPELVLKATAPLLVSSVRLVQGKHIRTVFDCWQVTEPDLLSVGHVRTRWAPPGATVLVPAPTCNEGFVCVLLAGPEELADELDVQVAGKQGVAQTHRTPTGTWFWDIWPVSALSQGNSMELVLDAETVEGAKTPVILESIVVLDGGTTDFRL